MLESAGRVEFLEQFRSYLRWFAERHAGPLARAKVDLSGVVQQTLLEAHQEDILEPSPALAGRLRRMLANNLTDELRRLTAVKRDIRRERSLEQAMEDSCARLERWIADEELGPCQNASRQEDAIRLVACLCLLPDDQRQAVELRYLEGLSLAETALRMARSRDAAAAQVYRGIRALRKLLKETAGQSRYE